mmetsp:Transcript_9978/g.31640  ORF Transcript_9978/g.31640 Transcript_9978/m.31640 type:complete len:214 (-) Transcript_9978:1162-1803(-)
MATLSALQDAEEVATEREQRLRGRGSKLGKGRAPLLGARSLTGAGGPPAVRRRLGGVRGAKPFVAPRPSSTSSPAASQASASTADAEAKPALVSTPPPPLSSVAASASSSPRRRRVGLPASPSKSSSSSPVRSGAPLRQTRLSLQPASAACDRSASTGPPQPSPLSGSPCASQSQDSQQAVQAATVVPDEPEVVEVKATRPSRPSRGVLRFLL